MRLSGRTALITGAASGIGEGIARAFAREGARVAIADLDAGAARAAAAAINADGGAALGLAMDVRVECDVDAGIASVLARFGGIDILVSNAGIQIVHAVEEFTLEEWRHVLGVHLDGAFLTTKAFLKHRKAAGGGGTILYMGSVHSKEASALKAPYVTAKHGLMGLAKVVAKEGAQYGVRANVICPGFVRTPLVDDQIPQQAKALGITEQAVVRNVMLGETVDGEFTSLQEVAEVAVWLAAFPSNALTGQSIVVSHGWHMQ
ncbi:MAG TPA: 3-hydroxybutyrate dehydrogenase [Steroidobacteraceae bacterium]|nr:3-hydroxybutyrate dehydrogenase [Steroidobacteraceae bacterium]